MQKKKATEVPQSPTRKAGRHLRVPVLPDEEAQIKELAASTGLSVASYLRNVGMGYQARSILDNQRVEELARINGDLGRLGGLLKLWLIDDVRTRHFGGATLLAVLSKIEDTQDRMQEVMKEVVTPRVKR
ncbi:MAG: traJ [Arthrobacter sp.]|nr:traJ [Arthrobacter sp.]